LRLVDMLVRKNWLPSLGSPTRADWPIAIEDIEGDMSYDAIGLETSFVFSLPLWSSQVPR
jgi:hypothetical protein